MRCPVYAKTKAISIWAPVRVVLRPAMVFLLLAVLASGGCSSAEDEPGGASPGKTSAASSIAPDFTLKELSGETVSLLQFRDKSNVLLHFGTTWCPPCSVQVPRLNELSSTYGANELVILSVDSGEPPQTVKNFARAARARYRILLDGDNSVAAAYGVRFIPLNVLVDTQGRIVGSPSNAIPEAAIRELVGR